MSFLSDIDVVPTYDSNRRLAERIKTELEEFLKVKDYNGPSPKIIIFRPTGRPADEFKEAVCPILEHSSRVYLVVAFSGQYKDISELVPSDRVMKTVVIYIQSGQLVGSDSPQYNSNKDELKTLATLLSKNYNVPMRVKRDGWSPRKIVVFIVIPVTVLVILAIVLSTTL